MILPVFMLSRIYQIEVLTNISHLFITCFYLLFNKKKSHRHEKDSKRGDTIENNLYDETLITENDQSI